MRLPSHLAGLVALAATALPAAAQELPRTSPIYAEFSSAAGTADVREVRLIVDGRDVTSEATLTPLRVSYAPTVALAPGTHSARVVVTDSLGRAWAKDWTFEVAAAEPALDQVWSEELLVEIEKPPRQVRRERLALAGWTQPGAEVVVVVDGSEAERLVAGQTGRFRASVPLDLGDNVVALAARSLETGDESPEVSLRVERLAPKPKPEEEDAVTRPPARRVPPLRPTLPRAVTAGLELDPESVQVADMPVRPGAPLRPREPGGLPDRGETPTVDPDTTLPERPSEQEPPRGGGPARREPAHRAPAAEPGLDPRMSGGEVPEHPEEIAEVVITKPDDGQSLRQDHVTVLGRAPAGWSVTLLVDDEPAAHDVANPAGRFTMPSVELGPGDHELIAEASSGERVLRSASVRVSVQAPSFLLEPASVALTSPSRGSVVARGGVQRVSGTAWDGAEIEVEVNGRIVAREIARADGSFDVDVPLEGGVNLLLVEASSLDGSRHARSSEVSVTAGARAATAESVRTASRLEGVSRASLSSRPRSAVPVAMPRGGMPASIR